jgi:hypothetical protein
VISAAENSNKFQKARFWKEKSVEDVVTLEPTAQTTLVYMVERNESFGCRKELQRGEGREGLVNLHPFDFCKGGLKRGALL